MCSTALPRCSRQPRFNMQLSGLAVPRSAAWAERSSVICTSLTRKGPRYLNAKCLRVQGSRVFVINRTASLGKV